MAYVDLIVDLGSQNTKIYKKGEGIVLFEPTVALLEGGDIKKVRFFGNEAKEKLGQVSQNSPLLLPVQEGSIKYKKVTENLLSQFVKKIVPRKDYFFKPKIRAFVNVPCGMTKEERAITEDTFFAAGMKEVYLIDSPIFPYFASPDHLGEKLIVDIGGGTTDIALLSQKGIILGKSYGIGGLNVDIAVMESIANSLEFKVSLLTAEKIKSEIATLHHSEIMSVRAIGKNQTTLIPRTEEITSDHIRDGVEFFYDKIGQIIHDFIKNLPNEYHEKIKKDGIIVTGGGSQISGLEVFWENMLELNVTILEEPIFSTCKGGAFLLSDPKTFNHLLSSSKLLKED